MATEAGFPQIKGVFKQVKNLNVTPGQSITDNDISKASLVVVHTANILEGGYLTSTVLQVPSQTWYVSQSNLVVAYLRIINTRIEISNGSNENTKIVGYDLIA